MGHVTLMSPERFFYLLSIRNCCRINNSLTKQTPPPPSYKGYVTGNIFKNDYIRFTQDNGPLHHVFQFPYIAGPPVGVKGPQDVFRYVGDVLVVNLIIDRQEIAGDFLYVPAPFPQRRQGDGKHVEAVV